MVVEYNRNMPQAATYWGPPVRDAFGVPVFPASAPIGVRWEDKSVLFRDAQGQEVTSEAVVYTNQQVQIGGYLFLGTSTQVDPRTESTAAAIRGIGRTVNLRASKRLNKAML